MVRSIMGSTSVILPLLASSEPVEVVQNHDLKNLVRVPLQSSGPRAMGGERAAPNCQSYPHLSDRTDEYNHSFKNPFTSPLQSSDLGSDDEENDGEHTPRLRIARRRGFLVGRGNRLALFEGPLDAAGELHM
jgi:hypothetical protein